MKTMFCRNDTLRWLFLACGLGLLLTGWGRADDGDKPEAPVRLKKKLKPAAPMRQDDDKAAAEIKPEKKPDEKKKLEPLRPKDKDDEPAEPEKDAKETVARIGKNMRNAEDRLAKKDPGDGTQQVQRDILKDLDALIEQSQQQQGGGGGGSSKQQQGGKKSRKQSASGQQQQEKKPKDGSGQSARNDSDKSNQVGKSGAPPSKIADLYKDIWGHLPETLRQEMDAYSREQFMAKYQDLLKQYYATIAEKGRKQGD